MGHRIGPAFFAAIGVTSVIFLLLWLDAGPLVAFLTVLAVLFITILLALNLRDPDLVATPSTDPARLPAGFGRALLGQMPSPLIVLNGRGRLTYANEAALGLGVPMRAGDHFANIFRPPQFVEAVNAVLADGTAQKVQFSLPGQDRVFEAQIAQLPAGGDLGDAEQLIVVIEDRTKEIRADAMRADFIANASHELRTPLASVLGYIETLQGHARDDPEARERFLGIMAGQAARMNRLVADLMSLSRIEMSAHERPDTPCDLFALMRETATGLEPVIAKTGATLHVDLPDRPCPVIADRDQIMQVFTNLIDNAGKYGGANPIEITAQPGTDTRPGLVGISVRDHGPGIGREHLHRLTERFYRVNVKQSREVGGTGLGLAIVKHILHRHGGELAVESEIGKGSRFTVWLPVTEPRVNDSVSPAEARENTAKTTA